MNQSRRKKIQSIITRAEALFKLAAELKAAIESVRDDEQEYLDNLSEGAAEGEKGTVAEAAIENLESAMEALGEIEDGLNDATNALDEAAA